MDEELGVKAPVTRLRRRLSTEAEGAKSPLTPSTPTKKRTTTLAKPALELIDENVTESVPKKATSKDIELAEERPVTPARRSTRIRSNTSLLMEATQNIAAESPRAKRALRRNSQLGSDTESTTTPARRSRARKDSTSSVDKLAVTNSSEKDLALVAEAITEEPKKESPRNSVKLKSSPNSTSLRKSPRLNKNLNQPFLGWSDKPQKDDNEKLEQNDNALTNPSILTEDNSYSLYLLNTIEKATSIVHKNTDGKPESKDSETQNISFSSAKLIREITPNPKKPTDINKTVSAIQELNNDKSNRKRTKSWTTLTTNDASSDNMNSLTKFASGDSIMQKMDIKSPNRSIVCNTSIENNENILKSPQAQNARDTIKILQMTPSKGVQSVVFIEDSDSNSGSGKLTIDMHNDGEGDKNYGDQCVPVVNQTTPKRLTSESFVVEPMDIDETIPENVTINDFSDKSNSSKDETKLPDLKQDLSYSNKQSPSINKSTSKSTRTSPISLQQDANKSKRKSSNTVSDANNEFEDALDRSSMSQKSEKKSSISILLENNNFTEDSNRSKRQSSLSKFEYDNDKRKSSTSSQVEDKINESPNKSNRKSVSESEIQNSEKTSNKSTLVLSQLRDVSENETRNSSKLPNDTNNELSKSVNIPTKETDKINQSNYLTSTPLHQKPLQKLAMQINTSIISPTIESKNTSKANKSKTPVKRVSNVSRDSDSSNESEEDSMEKSKMIDDEAEEASDDYESGDSRDANEKQYEEDHAVRERGETLESESNLSDDSDYEKDSFIVTSDEEDVEMLSGSGDDLSFSDNELKMTVKSKKKFDERKRKVQKNASREMYEARHQVNESDKRPNAKAKKLTGKKIESSASESEEEAKSQPKKKNRLRIDSSQDVSMNNSDADESVHIKKKKTKRLSESLCENNPNEREITIQNQSVIERNDPLAVAIKHEPKTPLKDFNMSTVLINENIEQVQIDTNASVIKPNETSDPLQAYEDEESDSDISENMEVIENYESVLEDLNKANDKQKKNKMRDTSLNLIKKAKDKIKEPIVDQLNLTETKSKKNKAQIDKNYAIEKPTEKDPVAASEKQDDVDNSDSIDMRLLFPEDSNDSEEAASTFKPDITEEPAEEFVPLKKTEAKTNLLENMGESEDTNVCFFIDTKGTYGDMDVPVQNSAKKKRKHDVSLDNVDVNNSLAAVPVPEETSGSLKKDKKKKKKNKSFDVSQTTDEPIVNLLEVSSKYNPSSFAPVETSINDERKKKKNKSLLDVSQTVEVAAPENSPLNATGNSEKKKKKNRSQLDVSQIVDDTALEYSPANESVNSEKKKKKNMSQLDVSQMVDDTALEYSPANESLNSEKKKKKNRSQLDVSQMVDDTALEYLPAHESVNSEKKKKKNRSQLTVSQKVNDTALEYSPANESVNSEKKKKKNMSQLDVSQMVDDTALEYLPANESVNSEKKKKKNRSQLDVSQMVDDTALEYSPANESVNSEKKKKKNRSQLDVSQMVDDTALEYSPANESVNSEKKKKKNKSQLDVSQMVDDTAPEISPITASLNNEKKKKKNKSMLDVSQIVDDKESETQIDVSNKNDKKKKKNKPIDVSQIVEDAATEETPNVSIKSDKKKKKNKSFEFSHVENAAFEEPIDQNSEKKKKSKSQNTPEIQGDAAPDGTKDITRKQDKKKKRTKSLDILQTIDNKGDESDEAPLEVAYRSEKTSDNPEPIQDDTSNKSKNKFKKKKKKSKKMKLETDMNTDQGEMKAKKRKHEESSPTDGGDGEAQSIKSQKKKKLAQNDEGNSIQGGSTNKSSKRKATDDTQRNPKMFKGNFFEKIHVPRLPESIVNQLDDKPSPNQPKPKKPKMTIGNAISTMPFIVEEGPRRKNKPSNYLEQSIYLNDSKSPVQQQKKVKNPKVLPFTPTVITSGKGFTSKFNINVLPQDIDFIAQASDVTNFRNQYLSKQRTNKIKVEHYKKQRNKKLAKF